jgi:signal transduction histidine kinase
VTSPHETAGGRVTAQTSGGLAQKVITSYALVTIALISALGFALFTLRNALSERRYAEERSWPTLRAVDHLVATQETIVSALGKRDPTAVSVKGDNNVGEDTHAPLEALLGRRKSELESLRRMVDSADFSFEEWRSFERATTAIDSATSPATSHDDESKTLASYIKTSSTLRQRIDTEAAQSRENASRAFAIAGGASLAALLVTYLTWRQLRRALAPLRELKARAYAVAAGDLAPKAKLPAHDEISLLHNTFEEMVEAVSGARNRAVANERFAAIGKMASHVTHEIRNPLSSIGLNLEMLEEEVRDPSARALLTAIRAECARLEKLSEEYLRVARLPSPVREADDLARCIRDILDFVTPEAANKGHTLLLERIPAKLPTVLFDESQVRQAVLNLVRNAMDAAAGGTIEISVIPVGMSVEISVKDRGAGIAEKDRERIFDAFYTTKASGTGLGLAISRQIAEAHGGTLSYRPREGGGADFRFALPIAPSLRK